MRPAGRAAHNLALPRCGATRVLDLLHAYVGYVWSVSTPSTGARAPARGRGDRTGLYTAPPSPLLPSMACTFGLAGACAGPVETGWSAGHGFVMWLNVDRFEYRVTGGAGTPGWCNRRIGDFGDCGARCLRRDMAALRSWNCSLEEDDDLIRASTHTPRLQTVGFLIFAVGAAARAEAELAHGCLRAAFGATTNVTIVSQSRLGCKWNQHGTAEQKECWSRLMSEKVSAARRSPYDLTLLIDTDVYPNVKHERLSRILRTLKRLFSRGMTEHGRGYDIGAVHDSYWLTRPREGQINGGWLVYRNSEATDRFFACAQRYMLRAQVHEQDAYNELLNRREMRSLSLKVFPSEWACRKTGPRAGVAPGDAECVFVHKHGWTHESWTRGYCRTAGPVRD